MRRKKAEKREYRPDYKYSRIDISRFINYIMEEGKKSTAEKIFYDAFKILENNKKDPILTFDKAMENVTPLVEVASRRIGGANYQVPRTVRPERKFVLAVRWMVAAARSKKGKPMAEKLAEEFIAASNNEGAAVKKKQDTHRMAEANRAFAHFSW
jgi:small subunit ribosomal protein S7